MIDSTPSRTQILESIRRCLAHAAGASPHRDSAYRREYIELSRTYRRDTQLDVAGRIQLFEDRVREYDAVVNRVSPENIANAIAERLDARSRKRLAAPEGLPKDWMPTKFTFAAADHLSAIELDSFDGVVTGCTVAIALTGSVVLQSALAQGPRHLTLIPDYHLCIVLADQIVETVPEAFERLAATATLPTTFISGPSATSDIEMTRIRGVHGPRMLDVLVVIDAGSARQSTIVP